MKPNINEMIKFKKFFHQNKKTVYLAFSKHMSLASKTMSKYGKLTKKILESLKNANEKGMEIAMLINYTSTGQRSIEDIGDIHAIFADFDDGKTTLKEILNLPIRPHLVVQTSPGKFHAYWKDDNGTLDEFSAIQQSLARRLGTDEHVKDLSRVMRMPGTINWKYEEPFLAKIVHIDENAEGIDFFKFVDAMQLDIHGPIKPIKKSKVLGPKNVIDGNLQKDIGAALKKISADPRDIWLQVGMALHNLSSGTNSYRMWEAWSKKSKKFDIEDQKRTWQGFKENRTDSFTYKSIFWLANKALKGLPEAYDESTIASHFASSVTSSLRFVQAKKTWYSFDGVVWKSDNQAVLRKLRVFIDALINISKGDTNNSVKKYATSHQYASLAKHAELMDEFSIQYGEFDKQPLLFACANGVVELQTGQFRKALPNDFSTRQSYIEFNEEANCPTWINFLKQICCGDKELYSYIRRALGYTMVGNANLQVFFLIIGSGSNGKGVLMKTVQRILGDYSTVVAPNLLTTAYANTANGPSDAIAQLYGARMVVCTELPSGRRFDEAFVKQYAGGDELTARHSYDHMFTFKPEGKLWISTNEVPEISATDEAMWRRLKPIPFNATFKGDMVDPELEEKLLAEAPGILTWLIKAAGIYLDKGLGSCKAVEQLTDRLRNEADSIKGWLEECCTIDDMAESSAGITYESYQKYMKNLHRKAYSIADFKTKLSAKGFTPHKRRHGNVWTGFSVKSS